MNSRQPHIRSRSLWIAACLACAVGLVLALSSAPASARTLARTKLLITRTSPAQPTAGQTYTMWFQLKRGDITYRQKSIGCYATADGKVAPLLDQGTDGTTGHCKWAIPRGTSGKTFDGIIAVQQQDTGTWWYRGFDLPIR